MGPTRSAVPKKLYLTHLAQKLLNRTDLAPVHSTLAVMHVQPGSVSALTTSCASNGLLWRVKTLASLKAVFLCFQLVLF